MAGRVLPIGFRAIDASGNAYSGAKCYFKVPGTDTLKNTYTTDALSVANANPLIANTSGVFPPAFAADNATFDVEVLTSADVTIPGMEFEDVTAVAADTDGSISRDFDTGGRLLIAGSAGVVSIEAGPPSGDDTGGTMRIGGWNGTNLDDVDVNLSDTAKASFRAAIAIPDEPIIAATFSGSDHLDLALSGYTAYRIELSGVVVSADNALLLRFAFDATPTFKSGASDYSWGQFGAGAGAAGSGGGNATAQIQLTINPLEATAMTAEGNSVIIDLFGPKDTGFGLHAITRASYQANTGNYDIAAGGGRIIPGYGTPTYVRIYVASGTFSGKYRLIGKRDL